MDNVKSIRASFEKIGARLKVLEYKQRPRPWLAPFSLGVSHDRHGEYYELVLIAGEAEFMVTCRRPTDRHLVLRCIFVEPQVTRNGDAVTQVNLLCGHDERHWFVATVPPGASSVEAAKEALKPAIVQERQVRAKLSAKKRNNRKNAAFVRQGEWFFLPAPNLNFDGLVIVRNEPIARPGSTAHIVEELCRRGGVTVHVCRQYPEGLTKEQYAKLISENPKSTQWNWRIMTRDAEVYARGKVRHPDHKTITLTGWHRVVMNQEFDTGLIGSSNPNAFLD